MNMDDIERTLLVKPEVLVYKIPPRTSAKGYRAADWKLEAPEWTGRLRCVVKGVNCEIRLEDRNSGQLFAACPVEQYPGVSVESVTDSSRYFVICIQDSGRKAYIGIGFADRSDSFDLNVTLQDHFKQLKKEDQFTKEAEEPPKPNLDLAFKEGQTIRINIPNKAGASTVTSTRPKPTSKGVAAAGLGVLPPPPGAGAGAHNAQTSARLLPTSVSGGSLASSATAAAATTVAAPKSDPLVADLLGDFTTTNPSQAQQPSSSGFSTDFDDWGDFAAPKGPSTQTVASGSWEQF